MGDINLLWYSTRGSAVVSQILFTIVVILGILTAVRWQNPRWPAFLSEGLHRTLALTSLVFLAIHIVTAAIDPFTALGWESVLLPFAVDYRPLYLGLGSVAMYLLIALVITSLLRQRIGLRAWRVVHWLAYAFWPMAILHGIGTGTDAAAPWMLAINVACIGAAAAAVLVRIVDARGRRPLPELVPEAVAVHQSAMLNPAGFPEGPRVEAGTYVAVPGLSGNPATGDRLLGGPIVTAGAETYNDHRARLGPLPLHGPALIPVLEATGVQGRGGAGFPVGRKWRSVAERSGGDAVIVANGAEGKPTSRKDRVLMALRPHLVLDGALIAANAVGASEVVVFVGQEHRPAFDAMARAIGERQAEFKQPVRLVEAPLGYIVGESSAAVH
jgi:DMSO/TMAO reductase YedYZ heme-binding membrane subunit